MIWESWLTLAVVLVMLYGLFRGLAPTDVIVWSCLAALTLAGAVTRSDKLPSPKDLVAGFGNPGLVTVGVLFVVVEGLTRTGATTVLSQPLTRLRRSPLASQVVMLVAVAAISAFLNNTAVVAMFVPIVHDMSRRTGTSPSRLFMPMCYAATLGGVCTMMGTSTNLVVDGLLRAEGLRGLGMFELSWVGVPLAMAGVLYLLWASRVLLPDRSAATSLAGDPREYTVEMEVDSPGSLVGRTVEDAGLRHLPGLYLAEIQRGDDLLVAVGPHERLRGGDRLVFVGQVDSVVDLRKIVGLSPAVGTRFRLDQPRLDRCLIEAVVSPECPLVGGTIREGDFRGVYEGVVLAVSRQGERLRGKIGDMVLRPGDTLLLEASPDFARRHRHSRDFFLVSTVENSQLPRHGRHWLALATVGALVLGAAFGWIELLPGAMAASVVMLAGRCCSPGQARRSVDWSVLVVIGGALGIARALETSGAAAELSQRLVGLAGDRPWLVLGAIYLATTLCTELITNNAAAALMFPIAIETARTIGVSETPFAVAVMIAASCGFATPFGYQTNLMVQGPGGYRFADYVRLGAPLDLLMMAVALALIPWAWPF